MTFLEYINNWRENYKTYIINDNLIDDEMINHANLCNKCSPQITLYLICQDKHLSYLFIKKLGWDIPNQYYSGLITNLPKDLYENCVIKSTYGHSAKKVLCIKDGVDFFRKIKIDNKY